MLLEPVRRGFRPGDRRRARHSAQIRDGNAVVLALAADHVVRDTAAFVAACRTGLAAADAGHIVTFGVKPERPATEYGYIRPGEPISGELRAVAEFVEKARSGDPRRTTSRPVTSGTAATSCFAPRSCSTNTA